MTEPMLTNSEPTKNIVGGVDWGWERERGVMWERNKEEQKLDRGS